MKRLFKQMRLCRVCGYHTFSGRHLVREMMFGTGETFEYFECASCGCLQIVEIPKDMAPYYPPDSYHSFADPDIPRGSWLRQQRRRYRARYYLTGKGVIGRLLAKRVLPNRFEWLTKTGASLTSAILDVGCGSGRLLLRLQKDGFRDLTGLDPYVDADIHYSNELSIFKRTLGEHDGHYDLIMLHHSFEHMPDPRATILDLARLTRRGKFVLIRVPIVDSYAWQEYGTNWVALDAPRHFILHTRKSISILADLAGFSVEETVCDSTDFQFWGSEQYRRDMPLHDPRSYFINPVRSIFSPAQIQEFRRKAEALNRSNQGDQACFYLCKR